RGGREKPAAHSCVAFVLHAPQIAGHAPQPANPRRQDRAPERRRPREIRRLESRPAPAVLIRGQSPISVNAVRNGPLSRACRGHCGSSFLALRFTSFSAATTESPASGTTAIT